jgi:hypothetical protein
MEKRSFHLDAECINFLDGFCAEDEKPKAHHVRKALKGYAEKMLGGSEDDASDASSNGASVREDDANPVGGDSHAGGRSLAPPPSAPTASADEATDRDIREDGKPNKHDRERENTREESEDPNGGGGAISDLFRRAIGS